MAGEALVQSPEVLPPNTESLVPNPLAIIELAVKQGANPDQLTKLMELQERYEKNEARKAFVVAMNAFKANPPDLFKDRNVSFNDVNYNYAGLDQVSLVIGQALAKHDLSHRWETSTIKDETTMQVKLVTVTCYVTHKLGHSEQVTLEGNPDNSGKKNPIQQIGSTVTYLERYTLLAATGMAVKDQDDDGQGSSGDVNEQVEYLMNCKDLPELKKLYDGYFSEAKKVKDSRAMTALTNAKNKRRAELEGR